MTTYIALLRGVNVGGNRLVAMADLRAWMDALGFTDVRSLLQSGNLVFRGRAKTPAQIERLLETEAAARLALRTDFFVRTAAEWREVMAENPFPEAAERAPGHLVVVSLKDTVKAAQVAALEAAIVGPELVRAAGRHVYIVYPGGIGPSRLSGAIIDRALGARGTARNWNTVRKLLALAAPE